MPDRQIVLICAFLCIFPVMTSEGKGRQHFRSPLLKTVYQRMMDDLKEQERDHSCWYRVKRSRLPEDLCGSFLQLHEDEGTKQFLGACFEKADWVFTQIYHQVAKSFLSWFMHQTSVNGLLSRGSMFVFSQDQFMKLLDVDQNWKATKLLDLGAGDGRVTEQMAPLFKEVFATETSTTMQWRLKEKGYKILGLEEWCDGSQTYDVISCLNLLDRCERPIKLLRQIHSVLNPEHGRAVVACVIPFKPYIEFGGIDHKPMEYLHVYGNNFEEQVACLIKNVFEPAGFIVEQFTRLPYLCEGDLEKSFYVLDDAVFVLKPA